MSYCNCLWKWCTLKNTCTGLTQWMCCCKIMNYRKNGIYHTHTKAFNTENLLEQSLKSAWWSTAQKLTLELFVVLGSVWIIYLWILWCRCIFIPLYKNNLTVLRKTLSFLFLNLVFLNSLILEGGTAWGDAKSSEPFVGGRGEKRRVGSRTWSSFTAYEFSLDRSYHPCYFRTGDQRL